MTQIRKFILALACIAGVAVLYSCDKEKQPTPEPTPTEETVSLKSTDNTQVFTLTHDKDGVHGTVEFNVTANLSNAVKDEITVKLAVSCEGISGNKITLTPTEVKIKADQKVSSAAKVKITDWSELAATEAEKSYTVSVKISSVSGAAYVKADAKAITATVKKEAKASDPAPDPDPDDPDLTITLASSIEEGYTVNYDNTAYEFKFWTTNGANLENPETNSVIGNGTSDVACDNDLICFTIDFKEVKSLYGFHLRHWGGSYCPLASDFYYSDNGTDWKYIGKAENGQSSSYYALLSKELKTRYIKYEMVEGSEMGRIDIMKFGLVLKD